MTSLNVPRVSVPLPHGPIPLLTAGQAYLHELAQHGRHAEAQAAAHWLGLLDTYLGDPAPLLAYTKLTGEAWLRTLPASEQAQARAFLGQFRAYLRLAGWFDAARPVNQFD